MHVLTLGEPLFELSHTGDGVWRQGIGGDTSNVAIAAARQGAKAGVAGRLGTDWFGAQLRAAWEAEGVDHSRMADTDAPTGMYFIRQSDTGHVFDYRRTGSAACQGTVPDPVADVLHLSGITLAISDASRDSALIAARLQRAAGRRVAFDPNLRLALTTVEQARRDHAALFDIGVDVALPGLDDARALTERDAPEAVAEWYLDRGCTEVALTLGADGVLLATVDGMWRLPSVPVTAVDASGAGDCFDGSYLARRALGDDPLAAARYAVIAAALSVEGFGAVAPIPHRDAVLARLNAMPSSKP